MLFGRKKSAAASQGAYGNVLGEKLNFGAAEAYRLLRTNLDFSLPDATGCKIIGVTSTLRGEGKSTTCVNMAYTMAQNGHQVLLLECDLRLPNAAKRLELKTAPGLSNLLTGQCEIGGAVQKCAMHENLRVITAGDIPPNPAELLGSQRMIHAMQTLSAQYDVIIVDLPPVSAVSDALIMSRLLSGLIVVVREGLCSNKELDDTMRQLRFTECKILGFVMTHVGARDKKYGYGYYRRYGYYKRRYGSYYRTSRQENSGAGKKPSAN